ncbi:MAG: hypothetical protein IPO80_07570 [Propionibacteriaceae bacterium]|nr:hypothetical protein [Propionibacteriaceae bacterium]
MRRVAVGVLVLLLSLTGCSQVLGIADWDKIVVNYTDEAGGDHALVVTPAEAISTIDGEETSHASGRLLEHARHRRPGTR